MVTDIVGVLNTASSLFIVATGLTLVFGALQLINLAHGSFYMYGAFLTTTLVAASTPYFWLALVVSPLLAGAMGFAVEVVVLRRLYGREHLSQLVATYALLLIFADIALQVWGTGTRSVNTPAILNGRFSIAGAAVPVYDVLVVGMAVLVGLGLWLLLGHTSLGWKIRASVDDAEVLAASGVNVRLLYTLVFSLGAFLAGLSGVVVAPQVAVGPGIGVEILVAAFIVAVIGGLGSVVGAAIGAVVIGIVDTLGAVYVPSWSSTFIYALMIIVLAVRPTGLLGRRER